VKEDFEANTPDELAKNVRTALMTGCVTEIIARERQQMMHLLESLALTSILEYPLRVRHTSERVPDFQLVAGTRRIGVELTRVGFQDIEHARKLQQTVKSTLMTSNLYPVPTGPRKKQEVIAKGFGIPQMVFPPTQSEEQEVWINQANETLEKKTLAIARADFVRGDENWLVIVDPLWSYQPETRHENGFAELLKNYWKTNWFSRVFLQDDFFHWQMAFSPAESRVLPKAV
jgi:hypothetical protein